MRSCIKESKGNEATCDNVLLRFMLISGSNEIFVVSLSLSFTLFLLSEWLDELIIYITFPFFPFIQ